MKTTARGFTLIELLIVIGILAILATTVVIVLNPAQLLAEARDAQRIQDMNTLTSAFSLFVVSVSSASADLDGSSSSCSANCFTHIDVDAAINLGCAARHGTKTEVSNITATNRVVTGSGWVPVNFGLISSGAPLALLPIDPSNTTTNFYSYACDNDAADKTYEVNANMESNKFASGGSNDVESDSKDGGNVGTIFERGSALTL